MSITATYHKIQVKDKVKVWYREAGDPSKPDLLLLHGFPTSSNMFRHLIPLLASDFHIIAPDLPGFGFTIVPEGYKYTFASLTETIGYFVQALKLAKFSLYIFDYGAPVGLRLALKQPLSISAIISQNGNAYEEGIDNSFWAPIKQYWQADENDKTIRESLAKFLKDPENIRKQYFVGVEDPDAIEPTPYVLDEALLSRPGQIDIQISLFYDYGNNVTLYPKFQELLRRLTIPILVVWGRNDVIFNAIAAEAYEKDAKNIKVKYFNTGHFALEDHVNEIGKEIIDYLVPRL